jgi:hypothetical protein
VLGNPAHQNPYEAPSQSQVIAIRNERRELVRVFSRGGGFFLGDPNLHDTTVRQALVDYALSHQDDVELLNRTLHQGRPQLAAVTSQQAGAQRVGLQQLQAALQHYSCKEINETNAAHSKILKESLCKELLKKFLNLKMSVEDQQLLPKQALSEKAERIREMAYGGENRSSRSNSFNIKVRGLLTTTLSTILLPAQSCFLQKNLEITSPFLPGPGEFFSGRKPCATQTSKSNRQPGRWAKSSLCNRSSRTELASKLAIAPPCSAR